jgi:hypothetical protein
MTLLHLIMATANGARLTKADRPALPVTLCDAPKRPRVPGRYTAVKTTHAGRVRDLAARLPELALTKEKQT